MFLPSPLYLLAIKNIAESGDPSSSKRLAVFICALCVMLFVEVSLVALFVRPAGSQQASHASTAGSHFTVGT